MFIFLLLTLVSANNNCSNNVFENTSKLTIEKCFEIDNNLIHLSFPFFPKNLTLINKNNVFCNSKYQPNQVYATMVNENIMFYPSIPITSRNH